MRVFVLFAACTFVSAQTPDPAFEALTRAYESLRARDYDTAIPLFLKAIEAAPSKPAIRKDLGYTYLKVGENDLARAQFGEAMRLDLTDTQAAMEYAFLCYESKEKAEARRIFDLVRRTGNPIAEEAFENIDRPLREGIEKWKAAIAAGARNFSAHFELATLADQRDELELAAEHYEMAWRLIPDRRSVLVDLGRVRKRLDRTDESIAALLAASRGGEPRAAERARELLPTRYPYVREFHRALELDPDNIELRRELAYLLLKMEQRPEAEKEFQALARLAPEDLLTATQLGFLLYARGEHAAAQPLFDRVLAGPDEDLANRVRAVLRLPQVLRVRPDPVPASIDAKVMAERSIKAGYVRDALKYLQTAHEADPGDFDIMLKLGWTLNILRQDREAYRWFDLARRSSDPQIAGEAQRAWRNLGRSNARTAITAWLYPLYSTRWRDLFSYGQVRLEFRTPWRIRAYLSTRFVGDTRLTIGAAPRGGASPQYLSESAFIFAGGLSTVPWHGILAWAEAGTAVNYLDGHTRPDYRGGVSIFRGIGRPLAVESRGWFTDVSADGVFLSRFDSDFLMYEQTRLGYTLYPAQFYWNTNLTVDAKSQPWANFIEAGPGIRVATPFLSNAAWFSVNLLRGTHLIRPGQLGRLQYTDFRAGLWYAFTR